VFTPWGILSAAIWVFSSILSIFAINNAGLAVSQGLWSGATIIVSFLWGALYFETILRSVPASVVALGLIVLGIAGISVAASNLLDPKEDAEAETLLDREERSVNSDEEKKPVKRTWLGIACALGLSITNGTMLVPIQLAPKEFHGINFIVSFGIGVLAVTPVFALIYFLVFRKKPEFKLSTVALPGFICGLGWNTGNWASIYATLCLGYTIGFPLSQCALLVGGFWGVVLFKEITGIKRIGLYVVASLILIGGAVMLGLYGQL